MSTTTTVQAQQNSPAGHYADINGLRMYYEIHGAGKPLVLIHGGGSTIESTFGKILPLLAKHYKVIAVELQSNGRTRDIDRPLSFEQDADDIAALLDQLQIKNASLFGFSNGGTTALQIAIRHPALADRMVVVSGLYKRSGAYSWLWDMLEHARLDDMPQALKDAYLKVNPDRQGLQTMHDKTAQRMRNFKDIQEADIRSIKAPVFVLISEKDVILPEHAVEMYRTLPHARLSILPGGHGAFIGEAATTNPDAITLQMTVNMIRQFLDEPVKG